MMKNTVFSIFSTLLLGSILYLPSSFAQDVLQEDLPEGAIARLGVGKGVIFEIQFSPDSKHLAVASSVGIWLYDAATFQEIALIKGHTDAVRSVAFSPDGQTLASGSRDETIQLWDTRIGRHLRTLAGHTDGVLSVAFSPNGQTLASGSRDETIRLWDTRTGKHLRNLTGHTGDVYSVVFSPDGQTLASASNDKTIRLWDARTGRHLRILMGHTNGVYSVAFSPDGRTIASGSYDDTVRLWDARSETHLHTLMGHTSNVERVAFSPDGRAIASASFQQIRLWEARTGTHLRTLTGHRDWVSSVAFSPNGRTIVSGSLDGTIRSWHTNTGEHLQTLTGHTNPVRAVSFSINGATLASGNTDSTIRLWDANTGEHLKTLTGHTGIVSSVAFSPDGRAIASGSSDHTIRFWDARTGRHLRSLAGHTNWVLSVAFNPNGHIIASGSADETIRLWDARTGRHLRTLTGHTGIVESVAFSPDGRMLASASNDNTIRLWDARTGGHLHTLMGHTDVVESVAFSPDRQTLASGSSDETIRLWDTHTGQHSLTLTENGKVYTVAFSSDGRILASAGPSNISLWDTNTGEHLKRFIGHPFTVSSVVFSPDEQTLASGSFDGTVLLWKLTPSVPSDATVSLSPSTVQSPAIGEQLTLSLKISDGENVAGYQATVHFNTSTLRYVESTNGDYLPSGAFFVQPVVEGETVTLAATSLNSESDGDGTLATITFEVVEAKASTVRLSDILLTDNTGGSSTPQTKNTEITEPTQLPEDVNKDGIVNVIDLTLVASNFGKIGQNSADVNADGTVNIIDLTLVAAAFGNTIAAPEIWSHYLEVTPTRADLELWLREAQQMNLADPTFQRGILVLEQLLAAMTPKETILLPNYPNPFNPETWIPYQLAEAANVSISIYAVDGKLVRTLDLGHQPVGIYESRNRAAHWNGRNALGEPAASGVYFYTLTAGEFTATRKMLIMK